MSDIFNLDVKNVLGAVVSAVLSAVLVYVANLTNVSDLDWGQVLGIATTVGATSLLKSFGTSSEGDFAGVLPVK